MQRHGNLLSPQRAGPNEWQLPSLFLLVPVGLVGIAIGWLVSQFSPGTHKGVEAFRQHPWYTVWSALSALDVALWLVLGCVALSQVWSLALEEGGKRRNCAKRIVVPVLGFLAFGTVAGIVGNALTQRVRGGAPGVPLAYAPLRVYIYEAVVLFSSAPSAAGLWMIRRRLSSLQTVASRSSAELLLGLDCLLAFRSRSQQFLGMLSAIVATSVFQTSALRNAEVGSRVVKANQFPSEFVLLYGAYFALAVAVVYLPSELKLMEVGRKLQNMAANQLAMRSRTTTGSPVEHWLDRAVQRSRIGQALGLDVPFLARLQTSLGIFAPLLASIIATVLPH